MSLDLYKKRIDALRSYYRKNKRLPTYEELARVFGVKSKSAAFDYIEKFIEDDIVRKSDEGFLIATPKLYGVRVLGEVKAGIPDDAEESILDCISLNDLLIHEPTHTFLLKVSGDSMRDAGIMSGDMVIVNRKKSAKPGAVVVAEIDHEWTLKFLMQRGKKMFLRAGNKKYPDLFPKHELRVGGVVTGVVRQYI
jgi:SOS regulatory protein LexA